MDHARAERRLTAAEALERLRREWRRAADPAERERIEEDAEAVRVLDAADGFLARDA